jgi:hypothetical protein
MGQVMMDTPPYGVLPYSDTTVQGPMGTVTVTSYSLTNNGGHVAGTFSFTARGSVTGGVKRVTGGSFDITFGKRQ